MHVSVCYLNKLQNARCNDKHSLCGLIYRFIPINAIASMLLLNSWPPTFLTTRFLVTSPPASTSSAKSNKVLRFPALFSLYVTCNNSESSIVPADSGILLKNQYLFLISPFPSYYRNVLSDGSNQPQYRKKTNIIRRIGKINLCKHFPSMSWKLA